MRLYKFLIITDEIINNPDIFKKKIFIGQYKHHITSKGQPRDHTVEIEYKNKFYTYINDDRITFMSFKYPNYEYRPVGYTIIDTDDIERIRLSISKSRTPWSVNHDTEDKQFSLEASLRQVNILKAVGSPNSNCISEKEILSNKNLKKKIKVRTGGYLNQGNIQKNKLHHFLMGVSVSDNTRKDRIMHHRGHTFDNRKEFLVDVKTSDHEKIHKETEPNNNIYRGKRIRIGDFFDTALYCNCIRTNGAKLECKSNCKGALLIDTIKSLNNFIKIIKSTQYKNLPR
ncbi:hypothetical protein D9O40_14215 [Clostridium autoethanogenum]|uniref:HNH endonuclease n=1 Tax=Clostridium autoethanogenum TaxID=84023 RepID=A0A3M0SIJ9_9CLOT|nr:hypothetical protein [Clostridium autoethanogenum]RMC97781.1 hypothetical protein D9O40_14215 [Clostridium autoethanogenum]